MKNPLTPRGIKQATFRFVAQHLNHCATAVQITPYSYTNIHTNRDMQGHRSMARFWESMADVSTFVSRLRDKFNTFYCLEQDKTI